ncbi:Response regulator receiver domain-containing protein [Flavobacteriaceae bacterium MAR_2010_188]|nr:Response regulator receiver domain-containing protein [Flavobacteriaceae bacterium MAR_2010_188]
MRPQKVYMIVDDDLDDYDFFCAAMKEIDPKCKIVMAKNGEDALQQLGQDNFELPNYIFLDLNMPRMDGKTCLSHLKKNERLKHIPVVIYTTSSSQKHKTETLKLGADYFLSKPASYRSIVSQLQKLLDSLSLLSK